MENVLIGNWYSTGGSNGCFAEFRISFPLASFCATLFKNRVPVFRMNGSETDGCGGSSRYECGSIGQNLRIDACRCGINESHRVEPIFLMASTVCRIELSMIFRNSFEISFELSLIADAVLSCDRIMIWYAWTLP